MRDMKQLICKILKLRKVYDMIPQDKLAEELKNCKIREGSMLKRSKFLKEWRKRWIVLTNNYLISFTNQKCQEVTDVIDIRSLKSYKSYVSKAEEMIPASIKMRTGDTAFYLCAANVEEKWSWIVTLERLIDFKTCGASSYNNQQFIKQKGFPSQHQFIDPSTTPQAILSIQKAQIQQVQKYKKNLQLESQILVKEIKLEKQSLIKERTKLNQIKSIRMSLVNPNENGNQHNIDFLQEIDKVTEAETMKTSKQLMMESIFDQFSLDSDDYFAFKFSVQYIVNLVANQRLGYRKIFDELCKNHYNRLNFLKIMLQTLGEYEPPILATDNGQNRTSAQVYSIAQLVKQMQTFENWVKFIKVVLKSNLSNQMTVVQKDKIYNKLKSFLLSDDSDSTDEVGDILDAMLVMNEIQQYYKKDLVLRLQKMIKMSSHEQLSKKASTLLAACK